VILKRARLAPAGLLLSFSGAYSTVDPSAFEMQDTPSRKRGGPFLAHGLTLRGDPSVKPITSQRAARCRSLNGSGSPSDCGIACGRSNDKNAGEIWRTIGAGTIGCVDCYVFKSNRRQACVQPEACVQMPERMTQIRPSTTVRAARDSGTSRLSCGKPRESRVFTPIWESSGESRLHKPARET
jgi:hypothetical protein